MESGADRRLAKGPGHRQHQLPAGLPRLHAECAQGGRLFRELRQGGRQRKRRKAAGEVDLSARPAGVDEKSRLGDWGVDTIIGAGDRGLLVSAVDRKSKYRCLLAVANKTKALVEAALVTLWERVKELVLRITSVNGKEFAGHCELGAVLGAEVYFALPYDSKERGLNENTNGLVRQYFPKGTSLRGLDLALDRQVAALLN